MRDSRRLRLPDGRPRAHWDHAQNVRHQQVAVGEPPGGEPLALAEHLFEMIEAFAHPSGQSFALGAVSRSSTGTMATA